MTMAAYWSTISLAIGLPGGKLMVGKEKTVFAKRSRVWTGKNTVFRCFFLDCNFQENIGVSDLHFIQYKILETQTDKNNFLLYFK